MNVPPHMKGLDMVYYMLSHHFNGEFMELKKERGCNCSAGSDSQHESSPLLSLRFQTG